MKRYIPLIILFTLGTIEAFAISLKTISFHTWMMSFMGVLFCQFAFLKLIHLKQFQEGFSKYDLITKKYPAYGLYYPFIELFLGLLFLASIMTKLASLMALILALVGIVSVLIALRNKLDVKCVCMGTALDVPLTSVTLIENLVMGMMAFYLFF
jgi:uncharacterized membrane protein YphA (DoxX/SURF4 family)